MRMRVHVRACACACVCLRAAGLMACLSVLAQQLMAIQAAPTSSGTQAQAQHIMAAITQLVQHLQPPQAAVATCMPPQLLQQAGLPPCPAGAIPTHAGRRMLHAATLHGVMCIWVSCWSMSRRVHMGVCVVMQAHLARHQSYTSSSSSRN